MVAGGRRGLGGGDFRVMMQEMSCTPQRGARLFSGPRRTARTATRWSRVWHPLRGARLFDAVCPPLTPPLSRRVAAGSD